MSDLTLSEYDEMWQGQLSGRRTEFPEALRDLDELWEHELSRSWTGRPARARARRNPHDHGSRAAREFDIAETERLVSSGSDYYRHLQQQAAARRR